MKKIIAGILLAFMFSGPVFGAQIEEPDLISLDIKGMDIRDVFKILSQKSGLNIVSDSDVNGTITLYLKDVSVMDAISIVASTNKLAYEQTGLLVRVMNQKDYEKRYGKYFEDRTKTEVVKLNYVGAAEAGRALAQMKSDIGRIISEDISNTIVMIDTPENIKKMKEVLSGMDTPLVTEVFPLDYANAESVKDKINEMVSKDLGSVKFDEKTNKLVVRDTPQKIEDMRKVIDAFDEKTREVLIDANIIQVTLSDKYGYGIDWAAIAKAGDVKFTTDTNLSTGLSNVTPSTLNIATSGGNYSAIISLLKTYGETNILSRPRITVVDRQQAKILVGSKEVYVTSDVTTTSGGTYHTTDHVNFVDVGVRLAVTPEINRAGFVTLKIKPEVSSTDPAKTVELKNPDGSTRTIVPFVNTSEAETSVVVKDGTTIIIGGLMKDTLVNHKEKVPFLGDVPLLGKLFSTTGKSKEKTELVILLTPHVVDGEKTTEEAEAYMADWEKKSADMDIEMPEKPEIRPMAEGSGAKLKKEQPKPEKVAAAVKPAVRESVVKKPLVKKSAKPRQKWAPILGAAGRGEDKNTETPFLVTESYEAEKTGMPKAKAEALPLSTAEPPYEDYYSKLREEINSLAKQDKDVSGIKGEVHLQFTLDKEGFLVKGPIVLNNPDLRLVRSAVRMVKNAAPFLRFPKALKKKQAEFSIVVRYE
ncbi:MAG: secretin N-terminal domain-containing protein [Candidatus Omnitrophota bacterium]|jgi:MSHA type pilus biogenesis protein MshL